MSATSVRLLKAQREIDSVFQLIGADENACTASLAWAFTRSPQFLNGFLQRALGQGASALGADVSIQKHGADHGFTDIEIETPTCHIVVEAKRGWVVPGLHQLQRYHPRLLASNRDSRAIVTISEADKDYAKRHLPADVGDIPVVHMSWREVARLAEHPASRGHQRRVLKDLARYIRGTIPMQTQQDNTVYVVALTSKTDALPAWAKMHPQDIVYEHRRYQHELGGKNKPREPPNYIAFRHDGATRSVFHVEASRVTTWDDDSVLRKTHQDFDGDQVVYQLGPPIMLARPLPAGPRVRQANMVKVALDLLFTAETLSAALDATERRAEGGQ